jgi:hypothetical protein
VYTGKCFSQVLRVSDLLQAASLAHRSAAPTVLTWKCIDSLNESWRVVWFVFVNNQAMSLFLTSLE